MSDVVVSNRSSEGGHRVMGARLEDCSMLDEGYASNFFDKPESR